YFFTGFALSMTGILLCISAALGEHTFTTDTWPASVSELVASDSTSWGKLFFAFEGIGALLVFFSWRFARTHMTQELSETLRMTRHIFITLGFLFVVIVPTNDGSSAGDIILQVVHYIAAVSACTLHP